MEPCSCLNYCLLLWRVPAGHKAWGWPAAGHSCLPVACQASAGCTCTDCTCKLCPALRSMLLSEGLPCSCSCCCVECMQGTEHEQGRPLQSGCFELMLMQGKQAGNSRWCCRFLSLPQLPQQKREITGERQSWQPVCLTDDAGSQAAASVPQQHTSTLAADQLRVWRAGCKPSRAVPQRKVMFLTACSFMCGA